MLRPQFKIVTLLGVLGLLNACVPGGPDTEQDPLAGLIEGTGIYKRQVSTESLAAQDFFNQGLRLTWGYHFPEFGGDSAKPGNNGKQRQYQRLAGRPPLSIYPIYPYKKF